MEKKKDHGFLHFLHIAYDEYESCVKTGDSTYYRFYNDFLSGHRFAEDGEDENAHERIMHSMRDLLEKRQSLVEHYFKRNELTEQDFMDLKKAHESTMPGWHPIEVTAKREEVLETAILISENELDNIGRGLNDLQYAAIAEWLNQPEDGEVYLYDCELTADDVRLLFAGQLSVLIGPKMNCKFLLKFYALEQKALVIQKWPHFFQEHKSLYTLAYSSKRVFGPL